MSEHVARGENVKTMTVFECEDSSDGIFTGIYDAWDSRLGHANVRLQLQGMHTLELFTQYRQVVPDAGKAEKVARTIRRKMGEESYQIIFRAAMAKSGEKADCIYRTLVQGLSSHISEKEAAAILEHLTDPAICKVFELSRRVWHEAHHYMGFVRFSELKNGVLFSEIEAENQVLPLLADHFADRLPNEDFLIYDRAHDRCLLHRRQRPCVLVRDVRPDNVLFRSGRGDTAAVAWILPQYFDRSAGEPGSPAADAAAALPEVDDRGTECIPPSPAA